MKTNIIYILIGGSGTGKTTLGLYLEQLGIGKIISHTTRNDIRPNEVDGDTYYFTDNETFHHLEKIEFTEYPKNSGTFYGLSKKEVDDKLSSYGKVFAITDVNGVQKMKEKYGEKVKVIYISLPLAEMEKRMRERGDSEENIQKRLIQAKETNELNNAVFADYVIKNMDLEDSKRQIAEIVLS